MLARTLPDDYLYDEGHEERALKNISDRLCWLLLGSRQQLITVNETMVENNHAENGSKAQIPSSRSQCTRFGVSYFTMLT
jgi:hypothetical protein